MQAITSRTPQLTLAELEAHDPMAPQRTGERRFSCPLPGCVDKPRDADHRSLSLNAESGLWLCHRCGSAGNLRQGDRSHTPSRGSRVRGAFGLTSPAQTQVADAEPSEQAWRRLLADAPRSLSGTPAAAYLAVRQVPQDIGQSSGARFARDWFGRPAVVFPIRDGFGDVVAVTGRYIDGRDDPKTRHHGDAKTGLFGTPGALDSEPLVLTEAPLDALSLAACGIPALARCGIQAEHTRLPGWLPARIAFRRVAVAFDADAAGDSAALAVATPLQRFGARVERWRPSDAKDWNEMLQAWGTNRLRERHFDELALPRWKEAWERHHRTPHLALERAIDTRHWQDFHHQLEVYHTAARN